MAGPFTISIKDQELSDELRAFVVSISVCESIDELDALAVEFRVPVGAAATKLLKLAVPGVTMAITFETDAGKLECAGDVMEVVHRSSGGGWLITLYGLERLHRLRKMTAVPKVWKGSHAKIVKSIAQAGGMTAKAEGVDDTAAFTLQFHSDDAAFLKHLAWQHNYFLRVEGSVLRFGRRSTTSGKTVKLKVGAEVDRYEIRSSLYDVATEVQTYGHDYMQNKAVKGKAAKAKLTNISGGDTGAKLAAKAFGGRDVVLASLPITTTTAANAIAAAELQRRGDTFVRGQLRCEGRPDARSGKKLQVEAAPWPLTGPFVIRQSRHVYDIDGYTTDIEFYSDSLPNV